MADIVSLDAHFIVERRWPPGHLRARPASASGRVGSWVQTHTPVLRISLIALAALVLVCDRPNGKVFIDLTLQYWLRC